MIIRPAKPSDEAAIRACAVAAYTHYVARIGRAPAPMSADYARQIRDGIAHVAADDAGIVLGFIVFYPQGAVMHLENVAVEPAHSGRGIGRALIAFCEDAAREARLPAVELYTNEKMTENLALYPRLGYSEIARRAENGFNRVFFRKTLT